MSIGKEFEGKTVTDATIEACKELGVARDNLEFEVIQEEKSGVLGIGSRNAIIKIINIQANNSKQVRTDNASNLEKVELVDTDGKQILAIFKKLVDHFVGEAEIGVEISDRNILLKLNSEADLGFMIGKKGEMIKNLEFLLSRISSKQNGQSIYVSIDINSYREKREEKLQERVRTLVEKVISINRPLSLNPMNSYERRICYLIIEENDQVTYKTKEYGNLKKITIFPKKIEM
jgi:spoIIIJ-associated protein